jgi:MFS family permease
VRDLAWSRRRLTVACICATGLLEAVVYGVTFPYFSVRLQEQGLSTSLIGLNATVGAMGSLLCAPLFPRAIRKLGYAAFSIVAFSVCVVALLGLLASDSVVLWFGLRFLLGVGEAGLWVSSEAWLNHAVEDSYRARANTVFQSLYSLGFFIGPNLTYLTGYRGSVPVFAMSGLCIAAMVILVPTLGNRSSDGTDDDEEAVGLRTIVKTGRARGVMSLALVVGMCETAIYALLPVYGLHLGLSTGSAVGLLVAYTLGEVVVSLPIGWLADRVSREKLLAGCASAAAVFLLCTPLVIHHRPAVLGTTFIVGGLVVSIYNIALVLVGEYFAGPALPVVSTGFSMAYSLGGIGGSTLGGICMALFGPIGLPIAIGGFLGGTGVTLGLAGARNRQARE